MDNTEISGKWINTKTGETVIARNIILDGEEAIVVTNNGMIPMTEFTNFVQAGEEEIPNNNAAPVMNDAMMSNEDMKLLMDASKDKPSLDKPLCYAKPKREQHIVEQKPSSTNHEIIKKLFSKFDGVSVKVDIEWGNFPKEQINTLIDIFDVPKEEIAEYIANKYASIENIAEEIEKQI